MPITVTADNMPSYAHVTTAATTQLRHHVTVKLTTTATTLALPRHHR